MMTANSSRVDAMTAEDRQTYRRWARRVIMVYGTAWLALSVAAFAAPVSH
jgi:hypothetical protein